MDRVFVARSVVEPLGRPIDSKAGHYRTVEQLLQAPIWRFGRCGLPLSTVSCLSAAETLAVVPRRGPRLARGEICRGGEFRLRMRPA
jgi:hypothetical protein